MFTARCLTWLEIILRERFGHPFALSLGANQLSMRLPGSERAILFDDLLPTWHWSPSDIPCSSWDAVAQGFFPALDTPLPAPGAAALNVPLIESRPYGSVVHYDIFGLTRWMLARVEELQPPSTALDDQGRFPATSSHAFKHGYLERPVVDEWLHILGQVIQNTWPQLDIKKPQFRLMPSHDVDGPSRYGFHSAAGVLRSMAGDLLRHGEVRNCLVAPWVWLTTKRVLHPSDPDNTFDWIMKMSEQHGLKSAFYFICGRTDAGKDALYEPEHPAIRALMRLIHVRGHEIGLHPSYNSYRSPSIIKAEASRLRRVAEEEGISQSEWGGRMHFLRWEHPTTLRGWEQAGMTYDSTLGYADRPGFRCGTCFEYQAFDPVSDCAMKLRLRPLIAMDCTIMATRYLGLGSGDAALAKFLKLKDACRAVRGSFTLLWHNSQLNSAKKRRLYESVLA